MKLHTIAIAIFAIAAIVVATAAGAGNTTASFSDQVTSNANTFQAGTLQLDTSPSTAACAGRAYGGVPGNPGADTKTGCTAPAATFTGATGMIPTGTASATFTIQNIGTLSGTLSVGTPAWSVTTAGKGTCGTADLSVSATYSGQLAAGASHGIPVSVTVPATSQDGCQGATFTAGIPFEMNGASTTGFSDLLTSTGNTFTMGTIEPPTLSATTDSSDSTKIDLTWANNNSALNPWPAGTTFTGVRYSDSACTAAITALNGGVSITSGYPDAPGSAGTYYYNVTAHFHSWTATSNCAWATTAPPVVSSKLYMYTNHGAPSGQPVCTTGSSSLPCLQDSPSSSTWSDQITSSATLWQTVAKTVPTSASGWSVGLNITDLPNQSNTGTAIQVWYIVSGACGSAPSSGATNLIASISGFDITTTSLGAITIPLVANPAFQAPGQNDQPYICMRIANGNSGTPHTFSIGYGANAYVLGPFHS